MGDRPDGEGSIVCKSNTEEGDAWHSPTAAALLVVLDTAASLDSVAALPIAAVCLSSETMNDNSFRQAIATVMSSLSGK